MEDFRLAGSPDEPAIHHATAVRRLRWPDGTVVVSLSGEIDMATVPLLRAELDAACGEVAALLVVDASQVTFCGACGIDALAEAADRAALQAAVLAVVGAPRCMERVIRIANLQSLLTDRSLADLLGPALNNESEIRE